MKRPDKNRNGFIEFDRLGIMQCFPLLQSFCLKPSTEEGHKFTKAHQYIQRNPSVLKKIQLQEKKSVCKPTSYRVLVKVASGKHQKNLDDNSLNHTNIDVLSINPQPAESTFTAADLLNIIGIWKLYDILDLQEEKTSLNGFLTSFLVRFKSPVSAYILTKIEKHPELIEGNFIVTAESLDQIPKTARVPLVYIQGINSDASDADIRNFLRTMTPVLKINKYQCGSITAHTLKLSSVEAAIEVSKMLNHQSYGSSSGMMISSHQYKSSVTTCFFIASVVKTSLQIEDLRSEISQIGEIDSIFENTKSAFGEFYIRMKNIKDAKLACGIMNNRSYENVTLSAVFITPEYFEEMHESCN